MPGHLMTPSLTEAWTVSADQRVNDFTPREGGTFHSGDPFTVNPSPWPAPLEGCV